MTLRVLTRKNAPPLEAIFELVQAIIRINVLTKFNEDWTINAMPRTNILITFHEDGPINVASGVCARKNAPPLAAMANVFSKFHEDGPINVASRVLTRKNASPPAAMFFNQMEPFSNKSKRALGQMFLASFMKIRQYMWPLRGLTRENAPPPGGNVFQPTGTHYELFHEEWKINVASSVLTKQMLMTHAT
ncbi:hypothetical protein DPMN_167936 [Dreissena polymorpha]|uniref:Uncharacterized protein n=1 Tax=Dreissena polymorpha TaxID=45954 RepID=A0A9D4F2C7_DREPO|nr:hypothetical protein DPMN_167936 [Dreissena polymorpha]